MNLRYLNYMLLTLLCVVTYSCKKDLEILPSDTIVADKAITSVADLEQAMIGVYAVMGNTNVQYRTAGNADIIISSLMSDENYLPQENSSGVGVNMYRWQISPDDQNAWANWGWGGPAVTNPVVFTGSNYTVIDRANRVLRVIDDIPAANNDEVLKKTRFKGELLAIRAFCHFRVLKSYAENYEPQSLGIPYMESINDAPGKVKPARLTVGETFAKIERDLLESKKYISNYGDVTRMSLTAVNAIQARVFLFAKEWDKAIAASTEVINSTALATRAQFPGIWTDANNSEVIWKLKKDTDNDKIGLFYKNTSNNVEYAAAPKLVNSFNQVDDIRFASYIKIDNTRGAGKTPYLVNKYAYNTTNAGLADIKLFRVAEMYLIRAEAYTEAQSNANNFALASSDLNTLRSARILNYTPVSYTIKDTLIKQIYIERFKELAFEGHRYFDLRRRNLAIDREPIAADDGGGTESWHKEATDRGYYLPIPGFELRANENMVQNPIYR